MRRALISVAMAVALTGAVALLAGCATGRRVQSSAESDTGAVAGQAAQQLLPAREQVTARGDHVRDDDGERRRAHPLMAKRRIAELDLKELWPADYSNRSVIINEGALTVTTDSDGMIIFEMPDRDTLTLSALPCPDQESPCIVVLPVSGWMVPYRYTVMPDGTVARRSPWVEFRRLPGPVTHEQQADILCRSDYPATVSINGMEVKQYKTGIFFATVRFDEGLNTIRAEAVMPDGTRAVSEQEVIYEKRELIREPFPLWLDRTSAEPATDMELLPGEVVSVSFIGSKGQEAWVMVTPGGETIRCLRDDHNDYSLYRAELPLRGLTAGVEHTLGIRMEPAVGTPDAAPLRDELPGRVTVRYRDEYPLLRVMNNHSRLVYNLGAPRLGGPIRSELGPGVILKSSGRIGDNWRVRLSNTESGFISADDVVVAGGSRKQPGYTVTSMSCGPAAGGDVVTIPYLEQVPWEVYPDPAARRLVVTIFGAESAATWVTHRTGCNVIDKLTWEQTTPETFKVYINLKSEKIWGYEVRPTGRSLVISLKGAPGYDPAGKSPLAGLKIAIEAGHGGSGLGAVGLSGLLEKDINLDLSFRLGELCSGLGAEVVQVREADVDMLLLEKRKKAIESGADILLSIHANAGGRGYLAVDGTSTYWHNPFWEPLAQRVYDRLLETGLNEFGVVGSFNYTVTRTTQMPAILVEQAFLSHAGDEEKLADPQFRQLMAEKIVAGLIDYLHYMKE